MIIKIKKNSEEIKNIDSNWKKLLENDDFILFEDYVGKTFLFLATPIDKWPWFVKLLSKAQKPEDTGLGDTIYHLIGEENSEKFKKYYLKIIGSDCGCGSRRAILNVKYPYKK